jgi:hypothetical protein
MFAFLNESLRLLHVDVFFQLSIKKHNLHIHLMHLQVIIAPIVIMILMQVNLATCANVSLKSTLVTYE